MRFPLTSLLLGCSMFFLGACSQEDLPGPGGGGPGGPGGPGGSMQPPPAPRVKAQSTYAVIVEEDIVYAKGLSHQSLNSAETSEMSLKMDIYKPDNDNVRRPLYMFIHGGGFSGGSKQQEQIVTLGNYFASRGWIFASIDYRLKADLGTVPQKWVDWANDNAESLDDPDQFLAIYPAQRDAKAAMRWLVANAPTYNIDTAYITVGGGSAGAITAITVGVTDEIDYRDELTTTQDPTLSTTNLNQTFNVKTIIDFWGSKVGVYSVEVIYGHQRFGSANPPLMIAHGTADPTVLYSEAEALRDIYQTNNVPFAFYAFDGAGHGPWGAQYNSKGLDELSFDFIVEQQNLNVE